MSSWLKLSGLVAISVLFLVACQPVRPVPENGIADQANLSASAESDSDSTPADVEDGSDAEDQAAPEVAAPEEGDGAATVEEGGAGDGVSVNSVASEPTAEEQGNGEMAAGTAEVDPALAERGLEVYHQQYCGICHELKAAETTGLFGPPHNGVATTALERLKDPRYRGTASTAAEYLHESLVDPGAYIVEGYVGTSHAMPPYTHLSEEDLDALIAFLLMQK